MIGTKSGSRLSGLAGGSTHAPEHKNQSTQPHSQESYLAPLGSRVANAWLRSMLERMDCFSNSTVAAASTLGSTCCVNRALACTHMCGGRDTGTLLELLKLPGRVMTALPGGSVGFSNRFRVSERSLLQRRCHVIFINVHKDPLLPRVGGGRRGEGVMTTVLEARQNSNVAAGNGPKTHSTNGDPEIFRQRCSSPTPQEQLQNQGEFSESGTKTDLS
jgi:hypothetical protein